MAQSAEAKAGKAERLVFLARAIARRTPGFTETKGAGRGDEATAAFMKNLRKVAKATFGCDYSEAKLCGSTNLAVDFYFPDERTVVEIAFGLRNPNSEYERDIFKCLMAKSSGFAVDRLLFVSKPGAEKQQSSPGQKAIADYVKERCDLTIEIDEIDGTPEEASPSTPAK
jgi:D-alanyl-D-alanine dipeptidase